MFLREKFSQISLPERNFYHVSSASASSGPDEMDAWGTAPAPSTAFDEFDAWGATSDGDTVSTNQTKNVRRNSIQQPSDPYDIAALWDEDQYFC